MANTVTPLLAQAAPAVLSSESMLSWTIVVLLLGLAAAWGGAMVRLGRVEADRREDRAKLEALEAKQRDTVTEVAVLTSTLGRIEASQARVEAVVMRQAERAA
jgi:putative copper export protein